MPDSEGASARLPSDPDDDGVLIGFPEEPKAALGKAPAWARHLHDCMHQTKQQVTEQRHASRNREMAVDKQFADLKGQLGQIILLMGEESSDGQSGKGFIGIALRNRSRIAKLEGERNIVRGALLTVGGLAALLIAGAKAMVLSWVHGVAK